MKNVITELRWRGLLQDIMPGTEEQLEKEMTSGYVGFDPTADSLHIGNLVPIILLVHLQRFGHKPLALVGGATGMVGDPSGKSEERNLLSEEILMHNLECIKAQLTTFLNFDPAKENAAEMVNNFEWYKNMSFLEFIRDVGKHISINYMLAKDSVKKRVEGELGMSFTEFTYQLVQGYDFYWLYKNKNCKLQMGGSDQWGNIVTGTELIRRKGSGAAFAFTCPLLTKADGGKFGKTEKGNVWLDPEKTTPFQFYQFWLNAADEDAIKWIKVFTFLSEPEIKALIIEHKADPGKRMLQKRLARELTIFVHSETDFKKAVDTTEKLFTSQGNFGDSLSETDLNAIEGLVRSQYPLNDLTSTDCISFLTATQIFSSKGEAKKMILNGGVTMNRVKLHDPVSKLSQKMLWHDKFLLVQKGKKNYYLVECL